MGTTESNPLTSNKSKLIAASPELSVVISCFFEENSIDEFHSRLSKALIETGRSFEIIFVNDGSTDNTFGKLKYLFERYSHVSCVINFFRNFGQAAGYTAGIVESKGQHFLFLDSDLQLDPEQIPELLTRFDEGFDVVSGYRLHRKDPFRRILASKVSNLIMKRAAKSSLRDYGCTFKIFNGKLVRAFGLGTGKLFFPAEIIATATNVSEIPVRHHPRRFGKSGWTLKKLLDFNMDHLVNLSNHPFQYLSYVTIFLATLFLLRIFLGFLVPISFLGDISHGLLLNSIFFFFLIETAILCLVGEFVIRSFRFLQGKPAYIVKDILKR